jgi:MoaA/NifB/PqqE/SkfB family radical SAM enzyme
MAQHHNRRIRTVEFSKNSVNVFFHILTACNLQCRHCYINPDQHGRDTLDISTIMAWMDIFSSRGQNANIIFLGGEPTLHPHLSHAIRHARKTGYKSITVDTNGYLFHDILNRVTPDEVDAFSFSLDGATQETNDRLRGNGSYPVILAGIRESVKKGFGTSVIYTVSHANIHEIDKMPDLLHHLGVDRFFIQIIGLRGRSAASPSAASDTCLQVSPDDWLGIIPKTARHAADLGMTAIYPKVYLESDDRFECAGNVAENYFIFPNGRVYRCPLCEDYPIHSLVIENNQLKPVTGITETGLFQLSIPEGCVMNRLIQPDNIRYLPGGLPRDRIACCLLKNQIRPLL